MASHPLNYEPYPEVNPSGGPDAREQIHTDPDMFGAAIGRGLQTLGQGIEKADNEGFDYATMLAKQDDNSHANETNAWFGKAAANLNEKMYSLRGKDAEMFLPDYQKQIDDLRKQAVASAGNPYTAQQIDNNTRSITDSSYKAAARHAGDQKASWDQNSATEKAESYGGLAAIHVPTIPGSAPIEADPSVALYLNTSDDAARQAAQFKGMDGDVAAQRNRGKNVETIVKGLVADGSQTSLTRAWSFLGSQDKKIDPATQATIEQSLRAQTAQFNGQTRADSFMGRGPALPAGYAQRTFQIEGGSNPNAPANGSHQGMGQFSPALEARYGINDSNRTDPATQTRALSQENLENHDALTRALGHEPTPADYYLAHQQGVGGAVAHLSQPNLPAWRNMASTAEGQQKGSGWAKQAIWGNMTPEMKSHFPGGVESVTSGDFSKMWAQRFYNQPIEASGTIPGNGTQQYGVDNVAMTPTQRFQMATGFSNTSKGDVIARINNDPFLQDHPQAMQAALTHANKVFEADTASYADMERQQHIVEQQRKLISDNSENDYLKKIYTPAAGAKPLGVSDIVNDPNLSRESKDRLIKQIGGSEEKDDKTYGTGFVKAFQAVHAPAGSPDRITDPQQLYSRLGPGGDLTMAGVEKLRGEIDLKKSPEGSAESEMKKEFLRNAKGQISGSDEGLHLKDPKGDELYLKFMAQALPAYDAGRKQGKSPQALLDPDSPDYVGKIIKNFKRPMDQWFNDTIHDPQTAATTKPAFDIATVKSLPDLVTAYRAGNVSKDAADALALQNGWASRKPKAPQAPVSQ